MTRIDLTDLARQEDPDTISAILTAVDGAQEAALMGVKLAAEALFSAICTATNLPPDLLGLTYHGHETSSSGDPHEAPGVSPGP